MALVVESASLAEAVMPTTVPIVAFSLTRRQLRWYRYRAYVELVNVVDRNRIVLIGERTIGGSGSDGDRARGSIAFAVDSTATVTTPVVASMVKRPPSLSNRL